MVIQDTHLFTGTIADNIHYGRLKASDEGSKGKRPASPTRIPFIRRLPEGYQTMLYSDGSNLSQGQETAACHCQERRISNPPVLILDEATSSIDTRTEKLIEKAWMP